MKTFNVHEAKTNLSRLIEDTVNTGESFVIAKAGRPMVTVTAHKQADRSVKTLGFLEGKGKVPDDFDRMFSEEISRMFDGGEG